MLITFRYHNSVTRITLYIFVTIHFPLVFTELLYRCHLTLTERISTGIVMHLNGIDINNI